MRPVDADEAKRIAMEYLTDPHHVISAVAVLDKTPTLTPPNEWVERGGMTEVRTIGAFRDLTGQRFGRLIVI